MKTLLRTIGLAALMVAGFSGDALAVDPPEPPQWVQGTLGQLYVDPEDIVVVLETSDSNYPCDATWQAMHVRRAATNFKEMYSLLLAAKLSGKKVRLYLNECAGGGQEGRAVISHGTMD